MSWLSGLFGGSSAATPEGPTEGDYYTEQAARYPWEHSGELGGIEADYRRDGIDRDYNSGERF